MARIFIVLTNTTISHWGVQIWVVFCVSCTPQQIINVGCCPRFLQTELDHSLIGLLGLFSAPWAAQSAEEDPTASQTP